MSFNKSIVRYRRMHMHVLPYVKINLHTLGHKLEQHHNLDTQPRLDHNVLLKRLLKLESWEI